METFFQTARKNGNQPYLQKLNPLDATNHRPKSIISAFFKNFERFLHQQMTNLVQKLEFMNRLQFGFQKHVSKADGFFLTESICKSID